MQSTLFVATTVETHAGVAVYPFTVVVFSSPHTRWTDTRSMPRFQNFARLLTQLMMRHIMVTPTIQSDRATVDRILVLSTATTLAAHDQDILSLSHMFDVRMYTIRRDSRMRQVINLTGLALWLMWNLWTAKGVFFRFIDYYAVVPAFMCKLYRRCLWIVLGGYDSTRIESIDYGIYDGGLRSRLCSYVARNTTRLLPLHEGLWKGTDTYMDGPPVHTGIASSVDPLNTEATTIPDGFNTDNWFREPSIERESHVLVVASVPKWTQLESQKKRMHRKGFDTLMTVANTMPGVQFHVVGISDEKVLHDVYGVPGNVTLHPCVDSDEMRVMYSRGSVVMLPSRTEGFPGVVGEAMLCECHVVASDVGGSADMIADQGTVVHTESVAEWVEALDKALRTDLGTGPRDRIKEVYSIERRVAELRSILQHDIDAC
jgi:glycosyltransferase involved in cell wall biosynthesis